MRYLSEIREKYADPAEAVNEGLLNPMELRDADKGSCHSRVVFHEGDEFIFNDMLRGPEHRWVQQIGANANLFWGQVLVQGGFVKTPDGFLATRRIEPALITIAATRQNLVYPSAIFLFPMFDSLQSMSETFQIMPAVGGGYAIAGYFSVVGRTDALKYPCHPYNDPSLVYTAVGKTLKYDVSTPWEWL